MSSQKLIMNTIKIPHLKIAHLGGNLDVGNIKIHQRGATSISDGIFIFIVDISTILISSLDFDFVLWWQLYNFGFWFLLL